MVRAAVCQPLAIRPPKGVPFGLFGIHMEGLRVISSGEIEYILLLNYA